VSGWIEVTDRLPDENFGELEFTDGKRRFYGYYQNGRFLAENPPDAEGGALTIWAPQGITGWLPIKAERNE